MRATRRFLLGGLLVLGACNSMMGIEPGLLGLGDGGAGDRGASGDLPGGGDGGADDLAVSGDQAGGGGDQAGGGGDQASLPDLAPPSFSISKISPGRGPTSGGTAMTITGSLFAQGATVTFANTPATNVTVVSDTQITCTLPMVSGIFGKSVVKVTNMDGQVASRSNLFAYHASSFSLAAATKLDAEQNPQAVAIADFDGDDKGDIAVANLGKDSVTVFFGTGGGSFGAPTRISVTGPQAIVATDLNGDGKPDLAVLGTSTASALINDGNKKFTPKAGPGSVTGGSGIVAADLNGDGKVDLALAESGGRVLVWQGKGDGTFSSGTPAMVGGSPTLAGMGGGDYNNDKFIDLVVANNTGGSLAILLGSAGGLSPSMDQPTTGMSPRGVVSGSYWDAIDREERKVDFNRDGSLDQAVTNSGDGTLSILLGSGDGKFMPASSVALKPEKPRGIVATDLNGDGIVDLAVAKPTSPGTLSVLIGKGDGLFDAEREFAVGNQPVAVAVGDLTSDSRLDLVTANWDAASVSVLVNTSK